MLRCLCAQWAAIGQARREAVKGVFLLRIGGASFGLPVTSQPFSRWCPSFFAESRPSPTLLTPARKATGGSCGPSRRWKFTCHDIWAQALFRAMGTHHASACGGGGLPWHTQLRPCLPPFPVFYPGAPRCRTVFLRYTCTVPKGPAGHSGPSASFPCSTGYLGDPCSLIPLSDDARLATTAGPLHTTPRNHGQSVAAVPPARPAGARLPRPRLGSSSEDQIRREGGQAEIPAADGRGQR
jgi:hypothetical protein